MIFAVAGSGKTSSIVRGLSRDKRSLIVTYTTANYENLQRKILENFNGLWPDTIKLMTYFSFLYKFCYKPFLADICRAKGITYSNSNLKFTSQNDPLYYMTKSRFLYSNRLALLIEKEGHVGDVQARLCKYYDELIIDEVQDIAGRDFTFLEKLMEAPIKMIFVGDFYQHTFDTSRDGNVNSSLFKNRDFYEQRFAKKGFAIDKTALDRSWRCSHSVCAFVTNKLGIEMLSHRGLSDDTKVEYVNDMSLVNNILKNDAIVKLHYQNGAIHGAHHKNWGEVKGEDCYQDVCVVLNKKTYQEYNRNNLITLPPSTRNKLYVAITRAKGDIYFIAEQ